MAKKIRNFAAILAVSAVVGTILLVLVFLLPVGPMRKNVEKSVGDMLKTGDDHFAAGAGHYGERHGQPAGAGL